MSVNEGAEKDVIFSKETEHFTNSEEIWDDSALIKMYEESIQKTYKCLEDKETDEKIHGLQKSRKWCVGDLCLAPYYEDDLWYPAVIKEISYPNKTCIVSYEEYNESTTVQISDLEQREDASEASEDIDLTKIQEPGTNKTLKLNEASKGSDYASNSSTLPCNSKMDFLNADCSSKMPKMVPPPPPMFSSIPVPNGEEAVSNMLLSWYMCGYHTGYYQAVRDRSVENPSSMFYIL